ncbi:branched-chain-amino-acid aminotransferase [Colletotrichum musicola]|uniref:Branched-chain-amino-acid aminotransferase n=1 Tax=Colletotrichum musicola TaxID=2175873 RepID=A0A8H6KJT1_9PEZI|nr:branched-chain-amino-acid aminotransferase [Colletotrichum musicola]
MIPPKSDYKWDVYDSKKSNVNGHVECSYDATTGKWSAPQFVESPMLSVHGLAPGLHYGQQVFEGLQARRDPSGEIIIFRPDANAARMRRSAAFVSMPEVPKDLFLKSVHLAIRRNAEYVCPHDVKGSLYIRPFQFGSSAQIGLDPPDEFLFCVFVQPHIAFHGHGAIKALVLDDFDRAATRGSGAVKVGGNYAPVMRWTSEAKRDGYNVLLHLDSQTQTEIDEFSTSSFLGIREAEGQTTLVVAESAASLDSITADSAAKLAVSLGWVVERRRVRFDELQSFTEVLAAGTAAGLVPVSCVYRKSTSQKFDFLPGGPSYEKLWGLLRDIQRGVAPDNFSWCHKLVE